MRNDVTVQLRQPISRLVDMLCSAFEGGSNYWYMIEECHEPSRFDRRCFQDEIMKHLDYPSNPNGYLILTAQCDGEPYEHNGQSKFRLDLPAMKRGLQVMAEKYPHHYRDFAAENDDAETGDVYLQCCLFGEAVFG